MKEDFMFTSESVTAGHPDKLCDQISDAIIDHILLQDPHARIRAECAVSNAIVFIASQFATSAKVDFPYLARKVIKAVGYDEQDFNSHTCSILTAPKGLPPDKKYRFNEHELTDAEIEKIPVRNQVTVFGFACKQTPDLMPLPIWLAHRLSRRLDLVRYKKILPYLTPDGKVQVGVAYRNREPYRVHSVTVTASQREGRKPSLKVLEEDIREAVIMPALSDGPIMPDNGTKVFVNPDGPIIVGGPSVHSGLTGRKSAVDTYGEYSRHSGDALSGKGPIRIDRVGAYMARYAAKNIVSAGLAAECEVIVSYSIGLSRPVSLQVQAKGTGKLPDGDLTAIAEKHFDFRLAGILKRFNLRYLPGMNPTGFYQRLAAYGHMGRDDMDLPWEKVDMAPILSSDM
jgi:S-adenosylmethionine synthetase